MSEKIIASFSAEQTAEFLRGGDLGPPTIHDPELAAKMERQRAALLMVFEESVHGMALALEADGNRTAQRLRQLWEAAKAGNPDARRLFTAMYFQLLAQALTPINTPPEAA